MWVIVPGYGFFSAVQDRSDPSAVLVRTRNERDLLKLVALLPDAEIIGPTERADYRWRLCCPRADWSVAVAQMASGIDYANVKDAVKERDGAARATVYMGVWSRLLSLCDRPKAKVSAQAPVDWDGMDLGQREADCDACDALMYEYDRGRCFACGSSDWARGAWRR
jgi:hypothetical protein